MADKVVGQAKNQKASREEWIAKQES